jgi:chemotaxis protein MotB
LKAQKGDKRAKSLSRGHGGGETNVVLATTKPGDSTMPGGRIYFEEFSAELSDSQKRGLEHVVGDLAGKQQKLEIRGHTSRRPLPKDAPYRDHFDLAYARCRAVQDFLVAHSIDSRRIRLAVSANNEPEDMTGAPAFGERNSRVEIRLLNEWLSERDKDQPAASPAGSASSVL